MRNKVLDQVEGIINNHKGYRAIDFSIEKCGNELGLDDFVGNELMI